MLPNQASGSETSFTVRWRPELEEVFQVAQRRTQEPVTHNLVFVTAAILIMARQGEEDFTAYDVAEFIHSNFAPNYRPPQAVGDTPSQRRWLRFDWEKWCGYVPHCIEPLNSASPMDVFGIQLAV